MSNDFDKALAGLQNATNEGANILLDNIRQRALYPDLASMQQRTHRISVAQAALPVNQADPEKTHLLRHIDLLKRELRKLKETP